MQTPSFSGKHYSRGSLIPLFAVSLLVIISFIGFSITTVHLAGQKARLQHASEGAIVVNGLVLDNLSAKQRRALIRSYLAAMYPETYESIDIDVSDLPQKINLERSTHLLFSDWLKFTQVENNSQIILKSDIAVDTTQGNIEVALVLDNSGSMHRDIDTLRDSANLFIDELFRARAHDEQVYISLIPFSNGVNLGVSRNHWFTGGLPSDAATKGVCAEFRYPTDGFGQVATELLNNALVTPAQRPFTAVGSGFFLNFCVNTQMMPLSRDQDALKRRVNMMDADGGTEGDHGILWGWRSLAEEWQESWDLPNDKRPSEMRSDVSKVLIFFSDGSNISHEDEVFLPACERIKDYGIEIYAIQFDSQNSALETCASSEQGRRFSYFADDAAGLRNVFKEISESVGVSLRLKPAN